MCAVNSKWRNSVVAAVALMAVATASAGSKLHQEIDSQMKQQGQQLTSELQQQALSSARQEAWNALMGYQPQANLLANEVQQQRQQIADDARNEAKALAASYWQAGDVVFTIAAE